LTSTDRLCLAALLHRLPRVRQLQLQLQLIVSPDTILRWHRELMIRRRLSRAPDGLDD
jgi:putative transposase